MANTVAELNTLADAAVAAFAADDYDLAVKLALQAQARLLLIPDSEKTNQASLKFDRESMNEFIRLVRHEAVAARIASTGPVQFTKLKPQPDDGCDSCCDCCF